MPRTPPHGTGASRYVAVRAGRGPPRHLRPAPLPPPPGPLRTRGTRGTHRTHRTDGAHRTGAPDGRHREQRPQQRPQPLGRPGVPPLGIRVPQGLQPRGHHHREVGEILRRQHGVPVRVGHTPAYERQHVVAQPGRPRRPVHRQLDPGPDEFLRPQGLAEGDQEALGGVLHGAAPEGLVHERDDPLVRLLVDGGVQLRDGGEVVVESPRLTPARRQMLTSPASAS
ncbi:hypothetical protein ACFQ51_21740 [Streptomyces kaempferi]